MDKIKNLDELLQNYIGPDKIIIEKKITNLMAPGENYLSDIQKIELIIKNKLTGCNEELDLVAKCCIQMDFGPTFGFMKNEIDFYQSVIPALRKFQEKHGITQSEFFPEFIGGRINLTGTDKPDMDAVLVLENLKIQGYDIGDRHIGFDLAATKVVLKDLATFHSTALALKLLEPETFKTEIKDNCEMKFPPPPPKKDGKGHPPGLPNFFSIIREYLNTDEKFLYILPDFDKYAVRQGEIMKSPETFFKKVAKEPFCTLVHSDMWINNTMQKLQDGVVIKNKLVDFQTCRICSLAGDLIFFLTSSVQSDVLRTEFDNLIQYYYQNFKEVLEKFGCYSPLFSYEKFLEELKNNAGDGIGQCMFMLPTAVFNEKGKVFEHGKHHEMTLETMPNLAKERLGILYSEAANRNWLY